MLCISMLFCSCGKKNEQSEIPQTQEPAEVLEQEPEKEPEVQEAAEEKPTPEPTPEPKTIEYEIGYNYFEFSEDRAWAEYSDDNGNRMGLIDTDGNLLYSEIYTEYKPGKMQSGMAYYRTSKENELPSYIIVDKDGNELGTVTSSEEYNNYILTQYQDKFLIMKEESGFSGHNYSLYIADKTGNAKTDELIKYDVDPNVSDNYFYMLGEGGYEQISFDTNGIGPIYENKITTTEYGKFIINFQQKESYVIDIKKEQVTQLDMVGDIFNSAIDTEKELFFEYDIAENGFGNPYAILKEAKYYYSLSSPSEPLSNFSDIISELNKDRQANYDTAHRVLLNDARIAFQNINSFSIFNISDGSLVADSPDMGGKIDYNDHPWLKTDSKYYAIKLIGADNKQYVVLLDENLNQLYEPVLSEDTNEWVIVNGYIILKDGYNAKIITPEGKVLSIQDDDVSCIGKDAFIQFNHLSDFYIGGGFINLNSLGGDHGYRSLDGNKTIDHVKSTEYVMPGDDKNVEDEDNDNSGDSSSMSMGDLIDWSGAYSTNYGGHNGDTYMELVIYPESDSDEICGHIMTNFRGNKYEGDLFLLYPGIPDNGFYTTMISDMNSTDDRYYEVYLRGGDDAKKVVLMDESGASEEYTPEEEY